MNQEQHTAQTIFNIMQQDHTDQILSEHVDDYLVIHRQEIECMSPEWRNMLCDLLEELGEKEYNYVVSVRDEFGRFAKDPFKVG